MPKVIVVGAGPVGLFCAIVRARAGDEVILIDRDAGPEGPHPEDTAAWQRRGVMQFRHPHFFRPTVRDVLAATAPDLWDAAIAAGGIPARPPGAPDFVSGMQCRRSTVEAALHAVAVVEPRVTRRTGHVERVTVERGRVSGVVVDGASIDADLVIDASGRGGRMADGLRPETEGGACGFSYVARMYRVNDDEDAAELGAAGFPLGQLYEGYLVIVFPQDARTLSALVVRATDDDALAQLRHRDTFEAAMRAVPHLARWTEPGRFDPITDVMPGGGLTNTYRGQARDLPGLLSVGDSMCTTNPAAGRGVSLGLLQAQAMLGFVAEGADDAAPRLDQWCDENIRPWYEDHVYWDATLLRRWRGEDIDLAARIPSDVICAAADVDPEILPAAMPYLAMMAPPSVLDPVQDRARAVLESGWRPPVADGPTRDELVELIGAPSAA